MAGQTFDKCGFTDLVPVQTVIVDEASQIEVGDYLLLLAKYKSTLRKMVFIGDDKQCECQMRWNRYPLTLRSCSASVREGRHSRTQECI